MDPDLANSDSLGEAPPEEKRKTAFEQYKLYLQMADERGGPRSGASDLSD